MPKLHDRVHYENVMTALQSTPVDVAFLRALSVNGFVNDGLRRRVWPLLLNIERVEEHEHEPGLELLHHKHEDTVDKDVARSLNNYDVCEKWTVERRDKERDSLRKIINTIMSKHPHLHYIQGYHDIVSVFLIVCGERGAMAICERLSLVHIRDCLRSNLGTISEVLKLLFPLVRLIDPPVAAFLSRSGVESYFALSWVLTWFAHNITEFSELTTLFDFLLASHPIMPLYMAAIFINKRRDGLLACDCELAAVHQYFQSTKKLNLQELLPEARSLFHRFPPHYLYSKYRPLLPLDSPLRSTDASRLYREDFPPKVLPGSDFLLLRMGGGLESLLMSESVSAIVCVAIAIFLWLLLYGLLLER